MKIKYFFTALLVFTAVVVATLPQWAEARAGGGRSMGSRGTHTFQSVPNASPIGRTTTSQPSANPNTGQNVLPPSGGRSF